MALAVVVRQSSAMDDRRKKAAESTAAGDRRGRGSGRRYGDRSMPAQLDRLLLYFVAETPVNALTPAQQRLAVEGGEPRQAFIWSSGLIGVPRA